MVILDWDLVQIEGAILEMWLPGVIQKGQQFAQRYRARQGFAAWIEDAASGSILIQQARKKQMPVHAIDPKKTKMGKEERAIDVSTYVWKDQVKMGPQAFNRVVNYKGDHANHFRRQIIGYRVGQKDVVENDLLDAFTYNLSVSLGNADGY